MLLNYKCLAFDICCALYILGFDYPICPFFQGKISEISERDIHNISSLYWTRRSRWGWGSWRNRRRGRSGLNWRRIGRGKWECEWQRRCDGDCRHRWWCFRSIALYIVHALRAPSMETYKSYDDEDEKNPPAQFPPPPFTPVRPPGIQFQRLCLGVTWLLLLSFLNDFSPLNWWIVKLLSIPSSSRYFWRFPQVLCRSRWIVERHNTKWDNGVDRPPDLLWFGENW